MPLSTQGQPQTQSQPLNIYQIHDINQSKDTTDINKTEEQKGRKKETLKVYFPSTKMILFETSTSVFELLWDIALALFILRLSFFYFLLSFASGCFIAYLRFSRLIPIYNLTQPQAELVTLPFWFVLNTLWARFLVVYYEIPRVGGFRLAIGSVALFFMIAAELVGGVVMWAQGITESIWETDPWAAGCGAAVLLMFGLMPFLLMGIEKHGEEEGYHGHGGKSVTDAVPQVSMTEKDEKKTN